VLDPNFESHSWRSTDGARSVQPFDARLPACAVGEGVASVRDALYVFSKFVPDCLFVSTDRGGSFRPLSPPPGLIEVFDVSSDGSTIILGTSDENFNHTGDFRSTDGGASFIPVSGLPNQVYVAFDPTDRSRVYLDTRGGPFRSDDHGKTFRSLLAGFQAASVADLAVDANGQLLVGVQHTQVV
jgi:hypothetical protein